MLKSLSFDSWLYLLSELRRDPSANINVLSCKIINGERLAVYSQAHNIFKLLVAQGFVTISKVGRKNVLVLTPKGVLTADKFIDLREASEL